MLKNKIKLFITCLLIIQAFAINLYAQTTEEPNTTPVFLSPFSRFGLGEMNDRSLISQRAMGDVSIASMEDNQFSLSNPASYSRLKSFVLETGINSKLYEIKGENSRFRNKDFQLAYLALAIPIDTSWKWGFSLGIIPLTKIGYEVKTESNTPVKMNQKFEGNGGFNKFYAGTSIQLFKNFYAGVNAAYLFGSDNYTQTLEFQDSDSLRGLRKINRNILGGIIWDAGIIYQIPMKGNSQLQLGLTANLPANINAKQENYSYTTFLLDNIFYIGDTLQNENKTADKVFLPGGFGGGIQFRKSTNFLIATDVFYRQWSQLKYFDKEDALNDYLSAGLGIQWSPKGGDIAMKGFSNYMKLIKYRAGFKYAQSYFSSISANQPEELRFSAGLGFPVGTKGSNIDLAIEFGRLGSIETTEVQERFVKISLGFHLYDETWFKRRKID